MDLSDIQGLVLHAYRRLPYAQYVLLRFREGQVAAVQCWLAALMESRSIDSATPKDVGPPGRPGVRLNVAFSHTGLARLGLDEDALSTFPPSFIDGLGRPWPDDEPDHRSRILGDTEDSAPREWAWGYRGGSRVDRDGRVHADSAVDAVLLIFATDAASLEAETTRWVTEAEELGAILPDSATRLFGEFPDDPMHPEAPAREAFGFVDGISQPVLKGARGLLRERATPPQPDVHEVEDGEFLLGHRDNNTQISLSPSVATDPDRSRALRAAPENPDRRDLGYNGTYLVFRQLAQHTDRFDALCRQEGARLGIDADRFKALLVGRWQDGSPITKCPIAHDPALSRAPAANDFSYADDPHGERCPIGAHIRRANPRDSLVEGAAAEGWRIANRHRIIRRGRPYGLAQGDREQGLQFICLNADIERQFEFIQQNWINDSTFGGLDGEDDPLIGPRQGQAAPGPMTLPPPPEHRVRQRVAGLSRFVTVRGGAYFFLPSLTALRYLSGAPLGREPGEAWRPEAVAPGAAERLRFLLLARVPILLAAALALAPLSLAAEPRLLTIVRPMFLVDRPWALLVVSALASLAAAVALVTFRLVHLHAALRFDVRAIGAAALTWRRVAAWQTASLPIVGTTLWRSVVDASGGPAGDARSALVQFGAAALGGYLVAHGLVFVAEALRHWSVRSDNPEDSVLMPPSRLLAPLKHAPSIIMKMTGGIVRCLESRIVTWPAEYGAGYVDHASGRILPGHLAAAALVATVGVIYVIGFFALRPSRLLLGLQLPPLAYLLFLLMAGGWVAAGATFFLDKFRVPLLAALAAWVLVAVVVRGTDHLFEVGDHPIAAGPSAADVVGRADTNRRGGDRASRPIVVVTAGGGGIHQAAWTARVLTGLTERWGSAFTDNLRLISAVSGGGVGAMHFLHRLSPDGIARDTLQPIVEAAKAPATGDVWWGLAYPDLFRVMLLVPFPRLLPGTFDRAWALERAWHRALGLDPGQHAPTLGEWQREVEAGWRPAVAFNATIVETGERIVLSTYQVPDVASARRRDWSSVTAGRDLSVVTAARLSATFPYVTPTARPSNGEGDRLVHLTDGGYWDNDGVFTAIEWVDAASPSLAGRPVLVIEISRVGGPLIRPRDRSWVWQQVAPLTALEAVRANAQRLRNSIAVGELLRRTGSLTWVRLPYDRGDQTLSWHLSRAERCGIERVWREGYADGHPELDRIADVLGQPGNAPSELLVECRGRPR